MQEQTVTPRIDPKAALAALNEAWAYYQPEPKLVRAAPSEEGEVAWTNPYYHAA
ncbi:hypothetical protein [Salipiger mucosus]|uniref:Uncharacterized protein n=1 Tax=Salipiger mucosus DSM 16094 TaxID=1123237 RepID=S9R0W6_9RHOB|nr:hypothetical protein [Salipiger mucosus]EPX85527.1 hypothetical protein Salmuc_04798 [Salipiger mucosus DSM 16094]